MKPGDFIATGNGLPTANVHGGQLDPGIFTPANVIGPWIPPPEYWPPRLPDITDPAPLASSGYVQIGTPSSHNGTLRFGLTGEQIVDELRKRRDEIRAQLENAQKLQLELDLVERMLQSVEK